MALAIMIPSVPCLCLMSSVYLLLGYVSGVLGIGPDQCEDMGFDSVSMANSITKQSSTESNHDRNSGRYSPDDKSSVVSAGTSVAVQSEPKLMHRSVMFPLGQRTVTIS